MHRTFLLLLLINTVPVTAAAGSGALRAALETGASALRLPDEVDRAWGGSVGLTLGVSLTAHARLQLHGALVRFPDRKDRLDVETLALSLVYDLDIAGIRPYIGAGLGLTWLAVDNVALQETTASLEVGVDVHLLGWLLWGVTVRYVPLFDSALLGQPAYATVNARLGAEWSLLD